MDNPTDSDTDGNSFVTRRRLLTGSAAGLGLLAGCGGSGNGNGGNGGSGGNGNAGNGTGGNGNAGNGTGSGMTTQPPRTLKAMSWGGEVEKGIVTDILNSYEQNHNVKINYQNIPFGQYAKKLQTQFAGNTEPDVFYLIADDAPKFIRNGALLELTPYVQNDPDYNYEDILDNLLDPFMLKGKVYGIPKDFTPVGLFHNTAHFEAAGAGNPETWDEFRNALDAIVNNTDVEYGMAFKTKPRNTLVQHIWQNGGRVLSEDMSKCVVGSQEAIEALEYLKGLHDDGLAAFYGQEINATWAAPAIGKEQVASTMTGAWTISTLEKKYSDVYSNTDVATPAPTPSGGQPAAIAFTTAWAASAGTEAKDASANLVKSLTDKDGMWKWVKTGTALPARKSLMDREFYTSGENPLLGSLVDLSDHSRAFVFGPKTPMVLNTLMSEVEGALTGAKSPDAALKDAQRQINNRL